jgi:hypothetical protein
MSPNLYLMDVPLMRRKGQPTFSRRSFCRTFTLHPRIAAYTCSSTHARGRRDLGQIDDPAHCTPTRFDVMKWSPPTHPYGTIRLFP